MSPTATPRCVHFLRDQAAAAEAAGNAVVPLPYRSELLGTNQRLPSYARGTTRCETNPLLREELLPAGIAKAVPAFVTASLSKRTSNVLGVGGGAVACGH